MASNCCKHSKHSLDQKPNSMYFDFTLSKLNSELSKLKPLKFFAFLILNSPNSDSKALPLYLVTV